MTILEKNFSLILMIAAIGLTACSSKSRYSTFKRHVKFANNSSYTAYVQFLGNDNCRVESPVIEIASGVTSEHSAEDKCYEEGDYDGANNAIDAYISFASDQFGKIKIDDEEVSCDDKGCEGQPIFTPFVRNASTTIVNDGSTPLFVKPLANLESSDDGRCLFKDETAVTIAEKSTNSIESEATCHLSSKLSEEERANRLVWALSPYQENIEEKHLKAFISTVSFNNEPIQCSQSHCNNEELFQARKEHTWNISIKSDTTVAFSPDLSDTVCTTTKQKYGPIQAQAGDNSFSIDLVCFAKNEEGLILPHVKVKVGFSDPKESFVSESDKLDLSCITDEDSQAKCTKIQ